MDNSTAYQLGFLTAIIAIILGIRIGLSDWMDELMKQISAWIYEKTKGGLK
jgi:ABC-type nitrate/sulfonate/bicarbonate transport system permease component